MRPVIRILCLPALALLVASLIASVGAQGSAWSCSADGARPAAGSDTAMRESTSPSPAATPAPGAVATRPATMSDAAFVYLSNVLDIEQKNSIHRSRVDWERLRSEAYARAQRAQTTADTYGAIALALEKLEDHHSLLLDPAQALRLRYKTSEDSPAPSGQILRSRLGYLFLAGYEGSDRSEANRFATTLEETIREVDAQGACGWIVDLRRDTGGNMWPVLAGLGPILGEGKAGMFVRPDGSGVDWSYRDGQAWAGDTIQSRVEGPAYRLKIAAAPVAVLTSARTASSGEAIVVAFRGRPGARSFGEATAGLATANTGFNLSDGAVLFLTTTAFADRTGRTYADRIAPDEPVSERNGAQDTALQAAVEWLLSQGTCKESG